VVESIGEILYNTIVDRKNNPKEKSYTNYLFDKGLDKILKKVGEESSEVIIEACKADNNDNIKEEIADLLYHVMVMMVEKGIGYEEVTDVLLSRHNIENNKEKTIGLDCESRWGSRLDGLECYLFYEGRFERKREPSQAFPLVRKGMGLHLVEIKVQQK